MLEAQSFRMRSSIKARHAMPPCRFEKTRSHNDATLACANRSFRRRRRAAAKSYSVGCVHRIALLCCGNYPVYDLRVAERAQCALSSEDGVVCTYVRYK